jgi:predicted alpha/beta-hydrolase family hydrolase
MVADTLLDSGRIRALICLGYPFHPPRKPEQLHTVHLVDLKTPTLVVQGTRDEFGSREEVLSYNLSPLRDILWLEDGEPDLRPRKRISSFQRPIVSRPWPTQLLPGPGGSNTGGVAI